MKNSLFAVLENLSNKINRRKIAIFPGKFKPPHLGHISLIEQAAKKVDEIVVIIANKDAEGVDKVWTVSDSLTIFKKLLPKEISDKVTIKVAKNPSPVLDTYQLLENSEEENVDYFLVKSSKDDAEGDKRFTQAAMEKALKKNIETIPTKSTLTINELKVNPKTIGKKIISSSDIRNTPKQKRKSPYNL